MTALVAVTLLFAGSPGPATATAASTPSIHWEKSIDAAQRKARKLRRPILVDFWAEWCGWCDRLDRSTYVDPQVVRRSQEFVAVKIDTEGSRQEREITARYEVESLPTIFFLSPEGRPLLRVSTFQSAYQFPLTMQAALDIAREVIAAEEALEKNPDDAPALATLGTHLYEIGTRMAQQPSLDEARELLQKAVQRDAERPSDERRRSRMLLAILQNIERNYAEAEKLVKDALSLAPQNDEAPKLLFVLGRTQLSAGRRTESVETFQIIVREYPQSPVADKARETLVNLGRR